MSRAATVPILPPTFFPRGSKGVGRKETLERFPPGALDFLHVLSRIAGAAHFHDGRKHDPTLRTTNRVPRFRSHRPYRGNLLESRGRLLQWVLFLLLSLRTSRDADVLMQSRGRDRITADPKARTPRQPQHASEGQPRDPRRLTPRSRIVKEEPGRPTSLEEGGEISLFRFSPLPRGAPSVATRRGGAGVFLRLFYLPSPLSSRCKRTERKGG